MTRGRITGYDADDGLGNTDFWEIERLFGVQLPEALRRSWSWLEAPKDPGDFEDDGQDSERA